jgi:hypothetical protein
VLSQYRERKREDREREKGWGVEVQKVLGAENAVNAVVIPNSRHTRVHSHPFLRNREPLPRVAFSVPMPSIFSIQLLILEAFSV